MTNKLRLFANYRDIVINHYCCYGNTDHLPSGDPFCKLHCTVILFHKVTQGGAAIFIQLIEEHKGDT